MAGGETLRSAVRVQDKVTPSPLSVGELTAEACGFDQEGTPAFDERVPVVLKMVRLIAAIGGLIPRLHLGRGHRRGPRRWERGGVVGISPSTRDLERVPREDELGDDVLATVLARDGLLQRDRAEGGATDCEG
jgi:hypothetical protein